MERCWFDSPFFPEKERERGMRKGRGERKENEERDEEDRKEK